MPSYVAWVILLPSNDVMSEGCIDLAFMSGADTGLESNRCQCNVMHSLGFW
jgi:hypothetical protein